MEDEEVLKLKKSLGLKELWTISVDDKKCYVKKPDRITISKSLQYLTATPPDMLSAGEIILRSCFVGGDQCFLSEDEYIVAAAVQCITLVEIKQAELIKN